MTMRYKIRFSVAKLESLLVTLSPLVYKRRAPLSGFRYFRLTSAGTPEEIGQLSVGGFWGKPGEHFRLETSFVIPNDWELGAEVALLLNLGEVDDFCHPEALVYVDGVPYQSCDRYHKEVVLPPWCRDGKEHKLELEGWVGLVGDWRLPERDRAVNRLQLGSCYMVEICEYTRRFLSRLRVALGLLRVLPEGESPWLRLLQGVERAIASLDTREPYEDGFYKGVEQAYELLGEAMIAAESIDAELIAVGHAHIDLAWLWPLEVSKGKGVRTFYTACRLMEQFPDFVFVQSQPQLYEFVRQVDQELFTTISRRVAQGRWEPIGGMWVEADVNLPGSEALVRQLVLGRTYFKEHFGEGAESPVLWLPDCFGFPWSLPQLAKEAGLEYFFTVKMGWNQYNRIPYDSFWWEGIDGTRILTHIGCAPDVRPEYVSTYNADASPEQIVGTWRNFQNRDLQDILLYPFGYGDGGGGPTPSMLENLRELGRAVGAPRVRNGSVREFFTTLESRCSARLPVWNGELYLERHRGTYTTQARLKAANRRCERLLHLLDFVSCLVMALEPDFRISADAYRSLWEKLCLNQFHDILPGSGVRTVNAQALEAYRSLEDKVRLYLEQLYERLEPIVAPGFMIVNPTSFRLERLVLISGDLPDGVGFCDLNGEQCLMQDTCEGEKLVLATVPPYGFTVLEPVQLEAGLEADSVGEGSLYVSENRLENEFLVVEFDCGELTRIYDKEHQREVLVPGKRGNQFQLFEDRPLEWDAWDIDIYYDDKMWLTEPVAVKVLETGPLRGTVEVKRRFMSSEIVQRVSLCKGSRRIDFDTQVDWREKHILLKVAFPVDILSPYAAYDIQWGYVERPTHRNTSWDWAKFECCAHKWVDLSERDYGVSLLNDCKYGHDVQDGTLRMTLLRGATMPDPEADRGEHNFIYSLLVHGSGLGEDTLREAYALNFPLEVRKMDGTGALKQYSLVDISGLGAVVETIKPAERGDGIVIRLYEPWRSRGKVELSPKFSYREVWKTDLLENWKDRLKEEQSRVTVDITPFKIITLRFDLGRRSEEMPPEISRQ